MFSVAAVASIAGRFFMNWSCWHHAWTHFEFRIVLLDWLPTKAEEYSLPTAERRKQGYIPFPRLFVEKVNLSNSKGIWTWLSYFSSQSLTTLAVYPNQISNLFWSVYRKTKSKVNFKMTSYWFECLLLVNQLTFDISLCLNL